ncbi:MAG: YfiR family protein [Bacteroidia bacterium]|nr:YfiR family protein [Bacteroidia bacterium]
MAFVLWNKTVQTLRRNIYMKHMVCIVITILVLTSNISAQVEKFQSVFIYNFTKYIEWPDKSGDFVIGVFGSSTVINELKSLEGTKKVGNQNILVKKFSSIEELSVCNILFISKNKSTEMVNIINKVKGQNTLLISEKDGLVKEGSGINFILVDNKQKFELNKNNVTKYGLKISPELEKLAIVIN